MFSEGGVNLTAFFDQILANALTQSIPLREHDIDLPNSPDIVLQLLSSFSLRCDDGGWLRWLRRTIARNDMFVVCRVLF